MIFFRVLTVNTNAYQLHLISHDCILVTKGEKNSPNHPSPAYILVMKGKKRKKQFQSSLPPGRVAAASVIRMHGVTLWISILPQACFQGWGVFRGDPGRPLDPNKCPGPCGSFQLPFQHTSQRSIIHAHVQAYY